MDELEVHLNITSLKDWFVDRVSPSQCKRIAPMTEQEREIVAQFLDRYEKLEESRQSGIADEENEIHSLRSILRNGSYSSRLRAKNEADISDLFLLLDVAHHKYPGSFPTQLVESIRRDLGRTDTS